MPPSCLLLRMRGGSDRRFEEWKDLLLLNPDLCVPMANTPHFLLVPVLFFRVPCTAKKSGVFLGPKVHDRHFYPRLLCITFFPCMHFVTLHSPWKKRKFFLWMEAVNGPSPCFTRSKPQTARHPDQRCFFLRGGGVPPPLPVVDLGAGQKKMQVGVFS